MISIQASWVKKLAKEYFINCGIAPVMPLEAEISYLEAWLAKGLHGTMHYLENHVSIRKDLTELLPDAKSVIVVLKNYYQPNKPAWYCEEKKISNYAWGQDYHQVIKSQMQALVEKMRKEIGQFSYRICVDTAPVLEKVWAKKAGVGWQGKNTNIIHPKHGSYFFIGILLTDLTFDPYDTPMKDYCGTCNRCIEACPTQALKPYEIDASRCISYLTIERKEDIPEAFQGLLSGWAYGCDICQQVCPWNRFSKEHHEQAFLPLDLAWLFHLETLSQLSAKSFQKRLQSSAMSRIRKQKWLNNLASLNKSRENDF